MAIEIPKQDKHCLSDWKSPNQAIKLLSKKL